jgi:hypothetical protein
MPDNPDKSAEEIVLPDYVNVALTEVVMTARLTGKHIEYDFTKARRAIKRMEHDSRADEHHAVCWYCTRRPGMDCRRRMDLLAQADALEKGGEG